MCIREVSVVSNSILKRRSKRRETMMRNSERSSMNMDKGYWKNQSAYWENEARGWRLGVLIVILLAGALASLL